MTKTLRRRGIKKRIEKEGRRKMKREKGKLIK